VVEKRRRDIVAVVEELTKAETSVSETVLREAAGGGEAVGEGDEAWRPG
jgi:hypothetical protein